jgi:hypothetical protein
VLTSRLGAQKRKPRIAPGPKEEVFTRRYWYS